MGTETIGTGDGGKKEKEDENGVSKRVMEE